MGEGWDKMIVFYLGGLIGGGTKTFVYLWRNYTLNRLTIPPRCIYKSCIILNNKCNTIFSLPYDIKFHVISSC